MRETFDGAVLSGRHALELLGYDDDTAHEISDIYTTMNRQGMCKIAVLYDPKIPNFENEILLEEARNQEQQLHEVIRQYIESKQAATEETP